MKLGLMSQVDESFTTIWLSTRSVSSWGDDLSPLSGLFFTSWIPSCYPTNSVKAPKDSIKNSRQ